MNLMRNINPTKDDISEWKPLENGMIAHRYSILTTSYVCYRVWEPGRVMNTHSTITHQEPYGWLGSLPTRVLPQELEALLPGSRERCEAVRAYRRELEYQAEDLIRAAFPQDFVEVS